MSKCRLIILLHLLNMVSAEKVQITIHLSHLSHLSGEQMSVSDAMGRVCFTSDENLVSRPIDFTIKTYINN